MKDESVSDSSVIDFFPLILKKRKSLFLYSLIGALLFFLGSFFFFSNKYYTEIRIVGSFDTPVETKYGDYTFSSNNLIDYTHNILDKRIYDKTVDEFNLQESKSTVKLKFKPIEEKNYTSASLIAYTENDDLPLEDFLSRYFKIFLDDLNRTSYHSFLEEKLAFNLIEMERLNFIISKTEKELQAYSSISDSVRVIYDDMTSADREALISTEVLDGVDILSTYSASFKKQLNLAFYNASLESFRNMSRDIESELNNFDSKSDFIPLFNQRIRMVSKPSDVESRSRNIWVIIVVGAFLGFLFFLVKLLAAQFKI